MTCYHCRRQIRARDWRIYIIYRRGSRSLRRYWCADCKADEIVDSEAPEQDEDLSNAGNETSARHS